MTKITKNAKITLATVGVYLFARPFAASVIVLRAVKNCSHEFFFCQFKRKNVKFDNFCASKTALLRPRPQIAVRLTEEGEAARFKSVCPERARREENRADSGEAACPRGCLINHEFFFCQLKRKNVKLFCFLKLRKGNFKINFHFYKEVKNAYN